MSGPAAEHPQARPPRVVLRGIRKRFGGIPVLDGVDLTLHPGGVLGLVGENGAGKSTLMNVLGGNVPPDGGTMTVDGRIYRPSGPADARRAGIAFVHQELTLFPNLSIADNLQILSFPRRAGLPWIDRRTSDARASALLRRVGLPRPPAMSVERLGAGERQLVEIARALGDDARVLILDEPTTSLGAHERDRLHALVRELRDGGMAIVYISHELGEVLRLADRVAVLRDGAVVACGDARDLEVSTLVRHMVGREVQQLYPPRTPMRDAPPALELRGVIRKGATKAVDLAVRPGELVGLYGLMGAGRSELARTVFGLDRLEEGQVLCDGAPLSGPPSARIARGLGFVTEDRRLEGLCLGAAIADNIVLPSLRRLARTGLGWIRASMVQAHAAEAAAAVRLTGTKDLRTAAGRLSGGNQQKVVLAKWLLTRPRVLMLDEPTRGIDVGARVEIYQLLHRLASSGTGLLVISSDLDELIGLCHRILVMRGGAIAARFAAPDYPREAILGAALPVSVAGGAA